MYLMSPIIENRSDQIFRFEDDPSRYAALKVRGVSPGTGDCGAVASERRTGHCPRRLFVLIMLSRRSLPRKEVIQPHVPVRLPCYDFTPLTLHTFDASLPEGLGRRLRVQTTRVV